MLWHAFVQAHQLPKQSVPLFQLVAEVASQAQDLGRPRSAWLCVLQLAKCAWSNTRIFLKTQTLYHSQQSPVFHADNFAPSDDQVVFDTQA